MAFPKENLEAMKIKIEEMRETVISWDTSIAQKENKFTEAQNLAFGNLCWALDNAKEYFNTAIESCEVVN
jgi:hypothetical protein